jgi:Spy/CpxP family protein refolding chaperone
MTMFRKFALGLLAAASLSAVALAPTAASAKPWGWGWGGGWGGGWGFHHHHIGLGFGVVDGGCYVSQLVATPFGPRYRTINVCAY